MEQTKTPTTDLLEWCEVKDVPLGRTVIVNIDLLRSHPLTSNDDTRIFQWISGLKPHPVLANHPTTLQESFQNMFINYSINYHEWNKFIGYLIAPESISSSISKCCIFDLCVRIGVYIPRNILTDMGVVYNPMTPKEDTKEKYQWKILNVVGGHSDSNLWSATVPVNRANTNVIFFRRRVLNSER